MRCPPPVNPLRWLPLLACVGVGIRALAAFRPITFDATLTSLAVPGFSAQSSLAPTDLRYGGASTHVQLDPPVPVVAAAEACDSAPAASRAAALCGPVAASLVAQVAQVTWSDTATVLAILTNISRACPRVGLPFPNRDLWRRLADAHLMFRSGGDYANELLQCDAVRGRACIVFIQTQASNASSAALTAYLNRTSPPPRALVLLSSCHDDDCVPFGRYGPGQEFVPRADTVARAPLVWALLHHPRVLAWFTENPCVPHPKLHPLPLGPHLSLVAGSPVIPAGTFDSPNVDVGKELYLRTMAAVARDGTGGRTGGMLVAVNTVTSDWHPHYGAHLGIRAAHVAAMQRVSDELHLLLQGNGPGNESGVAGASKRHGKRGIGDYVAALATTRYAWAPPGRGIDTFRTWECLSLGCIPVVLRTPLSPVYEGLPVLRVASFNDVNASQLQADWATRRHDPGAFLAPGLFAFHYIAMIDAFAAAGCGGRT